MKTWEQINQMLHESRKRDLENILALLQQSKSKDVYES